MQKSTEIKNNLESLHLGKIALHVPPYVALMILAFITGLITGVATFLMKRAIAFVSGTFTSHFHAGGANWALLVFPIIGILLTGIFQRYILRKKVNFGTERLNSAIAARRYRLSGDLTYAPIVGCTLTLGFGGSAGSEGPIAYTGAAIGSNIGRVFGADNEMLKIMLACGASAGIAAVFSSPVGGVLFSIEVLSIALTTGAFVAIFMSSVTAALTMFVMSGNATDLVFNNVGQISWAWMPWVLLLGVFCGVYSFYYSMIMGRMRRRYDAVTNPWVKNLVSGSILAILVFLFPPLFGEGYKFMSEILAGGSKVFAEYGLFASEASMLYTPMLIALGIILVKAFACASTNSGGGVAGDFAPTLMAGCVAGFFFATFLNLVCGCSIPVTNFAFFGMAAVMAGAVRAPFMAIFIVVEMSQAYTMLLPVAIAAAVSYTTVLIIRHLLKEPSTLPGTF